MLRGTHCTGAQSLPCEQLTLGDDFCDNAPIFSYMITIDSVISNVKSYRNHILKSAYIVLHVGLTTSYTKVSFKL